ncbi:hypothetical protein CSKR_100092 [Clonorchis sinensis]|uniref:Uncharacterized protein n=1 Tax=Clonorchis sinensis TaxID=79923 RepID=A0A419QCK4_CLOSI|nr:hypothetical protein CSKR_100092 [Clonorchis sinensis]
MINQEGFLLWLVRHDTSHFIEHFGKMRTAKCVSCRMVEHTTLHDEKFRKILKCLPEVVTGFLRTSLSMLGKAGSIPALVLLSGGMTVRHRKGATAKRYIFIKPLLYNRFKKIAL